MIINISIVLIFKSNTLFIDNIINNNTVLITDDVFINNIYIIKIIDVNKYDVFLFKNILLNRKSSIKLNIPICIPDIANKWVIPLIL